MSAKGSFLTVQNLFLDRKYHLEFFFSSAYDEHGVFLSLLDIPEYAPVFIIKPKQTLPLL